MFTAHPRFIFTFHQSAANTKGG